MNEKSRKAAIIIAVILGLAALIYVGGLIGQLITNYSVWMDSGGMWGAVQIQFPNWNLIACARSAFTWNGVKGMGLLFAGAAALYLYIKFHDKFSGTNYDERGFVVSKTGTYGTAGWMTEKEMKEVLELSSPEKAEGNILGEYKGKLVCIPNETRLNRHTAMFGSSGSMKSRAGIRNALFQAIKREESVICSDPKSEMYNDTSELFRKNGYEVKVFNLVDPEHSDSWNCMAGLGRDSVMAQVLTNVIIGNTSQGKGDHFWDNGETNLLKALILYVANTSTLMDCQRNLPEVYKLLVETGASGMASRLGNLGHEHPANAPYQLFAQASETVRTGIVLGLGTRLQVLQNEGVKQILSENEIDLTAPAKRKCAYFVILSDQEASMQFISSLFFSLLFIKLTRYADSCPGCRCSIPVNLVLDEFNNLGRIGGAADGSDFARSLSVIRSRDIRVILAIQSLGQLQNRYPNNLWAEILGNCDIQLMLGCTDDVTATYFSGRSGDMSIQVESTMATKQTVAIAQVIPQYRESHGHGKRKLLTPDEVLRLPNDEMLVVIRGHNILKLKKFDFTRHPMSRKMVPVSIADYNPGRACSIPVSSYPDDSVRVDELISNDQDDPTKNF